MPDCSIITIRQDSRACQVKDLNDPSKWVGAILRFWGQDNDSSDSPYPVAVVEYADGAVKSVFVERVRLLDSLNYHFPNTSEIGVSDAEGDEAERAWQEGNDRSDGVGDASR
jgi:hypothetical protein